ncbi:Uncharacterised protein [Vibrio cholerae]|nr:Uncharacterised protein [Vibrio cholerae]
MFLYLQYYDPCPCYLRQQASLMPITLSFGVDGRVGADTPVC